MRRTDVPIVEFVLEANRIGSKAGQLREACLLMQRQTELLNRATDEPRRSAEIAASLETLGEEVWKLHASIVRVARTMKGVERSESYAVDDEMWYEAVGLVLNEVVNTALISFCLVKDSQGLEGFAREVVDRDDLKRHLGNVRFRQLCESVRLACEECE